MFHSNILYSLINWGRASNVLLREIELLQNKFIRACLFQPRKTYVNLLFSKFQALKLKDMVNMEFAKFMYKYENHLLPSSFDNYFIKLESIHNYSTRQKTAGGFFYRPINSKFGRKRLHHICFKVWESISDEKKICSFLTFKRRHKSSVLTLYKDSRFLVQTYKATFSFPVCTVRLCQFGFP